MANPAVPKQSPATLQETFSRWQTRRANAVRAGLDPAPVEALYKQDWAKVSGGGTPMTAEQVSTSLDAAYGHPDIHKGRAGGLLGIAENVVPDVAGTLWNIIPGVARTVEHLPSEATKTAEYLAHATDNEWLQAHGYEPFSGGLLSHIAETTRNFARTPLLPLAVPGLSTAAGLTTAQGRQGLEKHPVGTLLDVAPFAGSLASVGAFGGIAKETIEAGNIAERADRLAKTGRIDLADKLAQSTGKFANYDELSRATTGAQRAAAALAAGRPLKALVRGVPALSATRLELLDRFNITPRAQGARRVVSGFQSKMARQLDQHARTSLSPLVEKGMSEEDVNRVGALAGRPDLWPSASAQDQAALNRLQTYADAQTASDLAQTDLLYKATLGNGKEVIYGGEQAAKFQAMQATLDGHVGKVSAAEDRVATLEARLEDAQRTLDTATKMRQGSLRIGRSISGNVYDPGQAALGITQATMIGRQVDRATRAVQDLQGELTRARADVADAAGKLHEADQALQKQLAKTVPARFQPLVESQVRTKLQSWLAGKNVASEDPRFKEAMQAFDRGQPLSAYIDDKTLAKMRREIESHWQELSDTYNPIWVPSMNSASLEDGIRAPRLRDRPKTPSSFKSSYINRSAGSSNYVLAYGQDYANKLAYEENRQVINDFIRPQAMPTSEVDKIMEPEYQRLLKRYGSTRSKTELQNMARTKAYALVGEDLGLGVQPAMQKLYKEGLWIPRDVADAIKKSFAPPSDNTLRRINMGSIRLYKHAVMDFSPTHKAHIWLGSMLPLMLGAGFDEVNPHTILQAWHMARGAARGTMPDLLNQHLALTATDDLMQYAHGLTVGRLVKKVTNAVEMSRKLDELGANFYRSWAYLSEQARWARRGFDPETSAAMGMAYANKAFVDVANLSPIEQVLAKSVFPFYSYTRWAMQYVMQYPVDHPIRASILSHLGESEKAYNDQKGIPNTLSMLFHLGKPDSKGDQWGVQYRAFNPFRDTASAFTLAGIFKNLGPAGRVLATAAGVNTLSGTPDPYPGLDIDPNTGTLVGTVRGKSPLAEAEQVVPELGILDHYLNLSQQARALRTSDPQAYRRQVFSILNMPFVPQSYTPYTAAATRARDQLRVAQSAVSAAIKRNDLGALDVYDTVPVPSKLRAYFGNRQYVPTTTFKQVVERILQWEARTGQKIT